MDKFGTLEEEKQLFIRHCSLIHREQKLHDLQQVQEEDVLGVCRCLFLDRLVFFQSLDVVEEYIVNV